jgi:hypothetical protein
MSFVLLAFNLRISFSWYLHIGPVDVSVIEVVMESLDDLLLRITDFELINVHSVLPHFAA